MNIRIPVELLGDLNSYKFISLILDKKFKTIYRKDFVKSEDINFNFFNKKIEYVTVPELEFEECDSIIFFPFSEKTNNWASKVMMWKNEEFFKFNGGFEFIKNADITPNMNAVQEWIDRGKSIKNVKHVNGDKNLIYFTVFEKDEYIELLDILLKTLKKQNYSNFELLFITDEVTKQKIQNIKNLKFFKFNYHIVDTIKDAVEASMQKLKIYEWEKIKKYKNILFLDVDIVVIGNLKNIFCGNGNPNVFYSATHNHDQWLHKTVYHCLVDYTEEQLKNFEKKSISALNAGQFFFKNTSTMEKHFQNINSFVKTWNGRYFFEQSFINYYFNLLELADTHTFDSVFKFVSINQNQTANVFDDRAVFVHFMGNAGNGLGKLDFMKRHYSKYI
jgi:hypothetical protein